METKKISSKFVSLVRKGVYGAQAISVRREGSFKKIYQLATNLSETFDKVHALELCEDCAAKDKLDKSTVRLLIDETAKKFTKVDPESKYLGKKRPVCEE